MTTPNSFQPYFPHEPRKTWTNKHENFVQRTQGIYNLWNPEQGIPWDRYMATANALQALMASHLAQGNTPQVGLRGLGAGWSLSKVAATPGHFLNTLPLDVVFPIAQNRVESGYTAGRWENLFLCQCGLQISQLNDYFASKGKSLMASGASNGQTIVGAMSTGTHGSAFATGSIPDCIRGLHILAGPNRALWVERATDPVLTNHIPVAMGAQVIRDDTIFNSALVSFGSFGLIHGVLVETEPLFLLEAYRQRLPLDAALRTVMSTLDFTGLALPDPTSVPYHFQVVVNPHDLEGGAYVTTMYKRAYPSNHTPPPSLPGGRAPGDDAAAFIGKVGDLLPGIVPTVVNRVVAANYPLFPLPGQPKVKGTIGETFTHTTTHGALSSVAMGIPLVETANTLDLLLRLHSQGLPYPGVFAFRWVPKSHATLSPAVFDPTCILEIDGAQSDATDIFLSRMWSAFDAQGLSYTFHWGKLHNLTAARVRARWGDKAVDDWIASRRQVLDPTMLKMFSNPLLKSLGMHT